VVFIKIRKILNLKSSIHNNRFPIVLSIKINALGVDGGGFFFFLEIRRRFFSLLAVSSSN
jgi:hypothetical protein